MMMIIMRMKMMNRSVCACHKGVLRVVLGVLGSNALQWISTHCNALQWRVLGCLMESKRMEGKLGEFVLLLPSFYFYHCIAMQELDVSQKVKNSLKAEKSYWLR